MLGAGCLWLHCCTIVPIVYLAWPPSLYGYTYLVSCRTVLLLLLQVSARGMDYPGVTFVLQVGLTEREQYIHRLGRTARAGEHYRPTPHDRDSPAHAHGFIRSTATFQALLASTVAPALGALGRGSCDVPSLTTEQSC